MREDREHGIAVHQIRVDTVRAPHLQRRAGFAQHQKTDAVIDLPIDQHDAADGGIARRARRLQERIRLQLDEDVRGDIDERPLALVAAADDE